LIYRSVFFHYAAHYLANRTVDKNFQVDDAVIKDFKDYLTSQSIPWNETELNGAMDWLRVSIKEYIVTSQFGQLQGCGCWPTGIQ